MPLRAGARHARHQTKGQGRGYSRVDRSGAVAEPVRSDRFAPAAPVAEHDQREVGVATTRRREIPGRVTSVPIRPDGEPDRLIVLCERVVDQPRTNRQC